MKKLLLIIYVILPGLFMSAYSALAQDRSPSYVAGLPGQPAAWATWRTLFYTERRMALGNNGDYTAVAKTGIHNFALQVPTPEIITQFFLATVQAVLLEDILM